MDLDNDHFPPSLPNTLDLDKDMDMLQGNDLGNVSNGFYDPLEGEALWGEELSPPPATIDPAMTHLSYSSSLDETSSSDSSVNMRTRKHSSDSSSPGVKDDHGGLNFLGEPPKGISIRASSIEQSSNLQHSNLTEDDQSNQAMGRVFDFESASSSPNGPGWGSDGRDFRDPYGIPRKAGLTQSRGPYSESRKRPRDASPNHRFQNQKPSTRTGPGTQAPHTVTAVNFANGSLLGDGALSTWSTNGITGVMGPWAARPRAGFAKHEEVPPPWPADIYRYTLGSPGKMKFTCTRITDKTRVETSIKLKLHIHPKPAGITKLHLQKYTLSKSKQFAKHPVAKSPEMLELHAMVVCASAVQTPDKMQKALERARSYEPSDNAPPERQDLPLGDISPPLLDDEVKPLDGGPVQICGPCIGREFKRSDRKKTKDIQAEAEWKKDDAKKIIQFNNQEVLEWGAQRPGQAKDTATAHRLWRNVQQVKDLGEVDITMRICCYCRHRHEDMGYQVIFTLKDYRGRVVEQEVTNHVLVTDDHKSDQEKEKDMAKQSSRLTNDHQIPEAFPRIQNSGVQSHTFRQSQSMTDLPSFQQDFSPQHFGRPVSYGAAPALSHTTSATMTPSTLSRQASPTVSLGRNKRRKASGSGRIHSDLTMTKLQDPVVSNAPSQNSASFEGPVSHGLPKYSPHQNFIDPLHQSYLPGPSQFNMQPSRHNTNPPTPDQTNGNSIEAIQRSQSAANLQTFPSDAFRFEHVTSPGGGAQPNGHLQQHAQLLGNQLQNLAIASQPNLAPQRQAPVIHELVPDIGPTAGGNTVVLLGSGFKNWMEIMFGAQKATMTTFFSENCLRCVVPPAHPGTVEVTLKHVYDQQLRLPTRNQIQYCYIDNDKQALKDAILTLINKKINGSSMDANSSAENINRELFAGNASFLAGFNQGSNNQNQMHGLNAPPFKPVDLERSLLDCLSLVDRDDSANQADFNTQGKNGQGMLHMSASLGYYDLVAGLLARGADPDLRDYNGMSPMHMAALRGHPRVIRKLRSAGGDPSLRSLSGYIPAELATSQQALDAANAFDHLMRPSSTEATPASQLSRASSVASYKPSRTHRPGGGGRATTLNDLDYDVVSLSPANKSRPVTPAKSRARSRRNSLSVEKVPFITEPKVEIAPAATFFAANAALSAWRDQIAGQIAQLQQNVHISFPTLQMPNLPPIPNLPDYQANTVVRRISSLVPQRISQSVPTDEPIGPAKEAESRWWEYLTGHGSSPPAYEEIYPENSEANIDEKKAGAVLAAGEAFMDQKCEASFERAESSSALNTGNSDVDRKQKDQAAHANKVKKLRSDRNLFVFWIPILMLVLILMLKDRVPQVLGVIRHAFDYAQNHAQERVVELL